ncbi:sensor domain-containing diguanylate cyclase [Aestuariirhabdus sp. Z084]|uniref:diguanylate cyclase n=1 Tax=Aestuariirhabdus haliotis TaxID=2918751 RepID=UPI00201B3CF1|nr:diguanylate cyclase [Aestuariirhabdus haliotis]MCL6416545.1 sensor domain-containing diguanylate cyclase [Aestuariirhabdus haliotis]MCL6420535.1 sensor domain-containing diguanylate cyclase [Aestuariirhabdus haliotis]
MRKLVCLLIWISPFCWAQPQPFLLEGDLRAAPLWQYAEVLFDPSGALTIEQVRSPARDKEFLPLTKSMLNQGITDHAYWIKVQIKNPTPQAVAWIVTPETSYMDRFDAYLFEDKALPKVFLLSDFKPFSERPIPYRKLNFQHRTDSGGLTTLYLRAQMVLPDTMTLTFHLWEKEQFYHTLINDYFFYGGYFSALLLLALVCLFLWLSLKESIYGTYLCYILSNVLMWGCLMGFTYQYLLPNYPILNNEIFNPAFLLMALFAIQFSRQFLNTPDHIPNADMVLRYLAYSMMVIVGLRLLGVYELVVYLTYIALAALLVLPWIGWLCYRKGVIYARWYIFAWMIYLIGISGSVLSASGVISWGKAPILYTQIAGLIEILVLAVAMSDKVRQLKTGYERATKESVEDPLTGLGNRRLLEQRFERMVEYCEPSRPLFLLLLDIDHFKNINDRYGHLAGDAVLERLASIMKWQSRPEDAQVRYGGEEFVLLLSLKDTPEVLQVAERIRDQFAKTPTVIGSMSITHTLSVGIAKVDRSSHDLNLALDQADRALYLAKQSGRNRVQQYCAEECNANNKLSIECSD